MNREIKFRAWDDGRMIYPTNALSNISRFFRVIRSDAIIMQYTGLKDKHEKEGYHKDILKGLGGIWIIEWQLEEARFLIMPYAGRISNWKFMDELSRMEIIGNVYENPKLL